jgi:hypothetical protein
MCRKPNSTVIFVVSGLVMLTLLGCSVGRAIVKGPQAPTGTATATHRATFTATISPTPRPTATPTATSKATVAASPTLTAAAPAESATVARVRPQPAQPPAPTAPEVPAVAAPVPPAAATAAPAAPVGQANTPFAGAIVGSFPNCGTTGVFGFVRDTQQTFVTDVHIRIWTDTWKGVWVKSGGNPGKDADRNYEAKIADQIVAGSWHVAVVKATDSTEVLSPIVEVTSSQNCEGNGAVQWTKVDFTKKS